MVWCVVCGVVCGIENIYKLITERDQANLIIPRAGGETFRIDNQPTVRRASMISLAQDFLLWENDTKLSTLWRQTVFQWSDISRKLEFLFVISWWLHIKDCFWLGEWLVGVFVLSWSWIQCLLSSQFNVQEMSNFTLTDRYNAIIRINVMVQKSCHKWG